MHHSDSNDVSKSGFGFNEFAKTSVDLFHRTRIRDCSMDEVIDIQDYSSQANQTNYKNFNTNCEFYDSNQQSKSPGEKSLGEKSPKMAENSRMVVKSIRCAPFSQSFLNSQSMKDRLTLNSKKNEMIAKMFKFSEENEQKTKI